jgi:hypothetical protein
MFCESFFSKGIRAGIMNATEPDLKRSNKTVLHWFYERELGLVNIQDLFLIKIACRRKLFFLCLPKICKLKYTNLKLYLLKSEGKSILVKYIPNIFAYYISCYMILLNIVYYMVASSE